MRDYRSFRKEVIMELEDLYDNNFNKLNKTIRRRIDEIPEGCYVMMSYALIKKNADISSSLSPIKMAGCDNPRNSLPIKTANMSSSDT